MATILLVGATGALHLTLGSEAGANDHSTALPQPQPVEPDTGKTTLDAYTTDRSVAYHILATPAYLLYGVTRPLGWGVQYAEQEWPELFEAEQPPRGGLPLIEFGGSTGFMGGILLYDTQLFGSTHEIGVRGLYGGPETFEMGMRYRMPTPLGPETSLTMRTNWLADPRDTFFPDGNASSLERDARHYSRDQFDVTTSLSYTPSNARMQGEVGLTFERADVTLEENERTQPAPNADVVQFLKPRATLLLTATRGRPRTYLGTELFLQFEYAHDLASDRLRYVRYVAELRQYLPIGIFPNSRRLAVRARFEQVEPVFGASDVPFYQLPHLGGQMNLRGFRYRRFQDDGTLVLSAEYRYPIWTKLDAVLFADAGQVFDTVAQVAGHRFHWSCGGGVHLLNRHGLAFRLEVAGSSEGMRTVLSVEPTFRRVDR